MHVNIANRLHQRAVNIGMLLHSAN